ncbi:MAG: class I SAM-dependent methyltransferase [Planctomycetota bacterium]|nr:MAG: class I SAM-dependent methyltransferase [Planctomycetota bacterium]
MAQQQGTPYAVQEPPLLRIGSLPRHRVSQQFGPPGGPLLVGLRQFWGERKSQRLGAHFRSHDNALAEAAYTRMDGRLFRAINARQAWANTRAIPKTLHRRAPRRPLRAIDLASGDGAASAVLAAHLAPGSTVIGLEYAAALVSLASARAQVPGRRTVFHHTSILEPWLNEAAEVLHPGQVDWVNCSGALAHHFTPPQLATIAAECARVLRPGGWAVVDARCPHGRDAVGQAFLGAGLQLRGHERSCILDRYPQLCFQAGA